jgi:hypothetical protein
MDERGKEIRVQGTQEIKLLENDVSSVAADTISFADRVTPPPMSHILNPMQCSKSLGSPRGLNSGKCL